MNSRVRRTPACGPRLVALLDLDVVPDLRQVAVRAHARGGVQGDDLLVRHRQHEVAADAVLQLEQLLDAVAAAAASRARPACSTGISISCPPIAIHLLADDLLDAPEQRQPSGRHGHSPAPTWRTKPARTSSRWEIATASAGVVAQRRHQVARGPHQGRVYVLAWLDGLVEDRGDVDPRDARSPSDRTS